MNRMLPLACLLITACTPQGGPEPLTRKAVSSPAQSGWARLPLDREAQRAFPKLWLGNGEGRSVPYLVARDDLWARRALPIGRQLLGKDAQDRPTAEVQLGLPEGWQTRDREHLTFVLEVEGEAPWACRVKVERALEGGAWMGLDIPQPAHVYDLGSRHTELTVPWDAMRYRLTLEVVHGKAPKLKGLTVQAATRPDTAAEDQVETPRMEAVPGTSQAWDLKLDGPDRIVGAEVELAPPAAPLYASWSVLEPRRPEVPRETERLIHGQGLLWNLPALDTRSTRVALGPVTTDHLRLRLPEGATPRSVRLLVRREVLIFPAQAGERLWLHLGGAQKRAPGSLEALPQSSRTVYGRAALTLGPAEADPEGLEDPSQRPNPLKAWLPWIAGLAVVGMGWMGLRLMRKP